MPFAIFRLAVGTIPILCSISYATEHYVIDPKHTYTSFEYQHWGLPTQRGQFDKSNGFIELDEDE